MYLSMKKVLFIFIVTLTVSLLSCNGSSQVSSDIDPELDSMWFSYPLVIKLTENGMVRSRPEIFRDSTEGHATMGYFLDRNNPYYPLLPHVTLTINDFNFQYDPAPFEIVRPWTADTVVNGTEFNSAIYRVPKTNTAIFIKVIDTSGGKGIICIVEFHGYWNNQNIDIAKYGDLITLGYLKSK